jgi:hypothetical protein
MPAVPKEGMVFLCGTGGDRMQYRLKEVTRDAFTFQYREYVSTRRWQTETKPRDDWQKWLGQLQLAESATYHDPGCSIHSCKGCDGSGQGRLGPLPPEPPVPVTPSPSGLHPGWVGDVLFELAWYAKEYGDKPQNHVLIPLGDHRYRLSVNGLYHEVTMDPTWQRWPACDCGQGPYCDWGKLAPKDGPCVHALVAMVLHPDHRGQLLDFYL